MDDFEPPPILPIIEDELQKYLLCPESLPIHEYERSQQIWLRNSIPEELIKYELSPVSTTLRVQRDLDSGRIIGFREVALNSVGATAKNSMSFDRAPAPPTDSTKGNALYVPFQPGSFPEPILNLPEQHILDKSGFLTVPPGFSHSLDIQDNKKLLEETDTTHGNLKTLNLLDVIHKEQHFLGELKSQEIESTNVENKLESNVLPEEEDIVPKEPQIINLSTLSHPHNSTVKNSEWAVLLDPNKPVNDFNKKIPDMAKRFPFELDPFQKLAILQLEQHNHVFVAAHTSAGKTVVAEYAIALSQKHMTRTIYTSPIKALSNQKYRDFRDEFNDVGLITGDFQINQKASCLIMTTEILRTMLYCGSDITRDLEYVIFDEVHYINDRDRGHVWEQVLIMLPTHVCVVLLSATVPNTVEFADWLGRTHQRKVYVITTLKRPVPLQHFLYTGRWGGSRDERFLILEAEKWSEEGYIKANTALECLKDKNIKFLNNKQEKTLWIALVDHLRKCDLLPVVAFIFSRQKCDTNAKILSSLDLTTEKEKHQIHVFFSKCIRSLNESDQKTPQIIKMRDILSRGIGIHHSGVLPIIKEIVEMLFQKGFIKILFATETFAMGVNMPARTVIFDSVMKHDGIEHRHLLPAEYIQMAGRAGRRGKDDKGTVILLCKMSIPSESCLKAMMIGLPSKLTSQFRLTYGMVLSLLRVETLSVEGMMSRSFGEVDHQKKVTDIKVELEEVEKKLEELGKDQLSSYLQPLVKFYDTASAYMEQRKSVMFETVFERKFLEEKKKDLEFQLSNASLILYPDYQNRIKLLRKLDYVDPKNRVKLKGKVACEMGMNELLITELVLEDVFINLQASEVAALLSALVFRVKLRGSFNEFEEELTPTLKEGIQKIKSHHEKIAAMELELGIQTDEFQTDLNFGLVHVVYRWANHEEFSEIMKLTDIQEGIIVRCIQQLNETIIDVRDAAKIIGDPALQKKMEDASASIKRNIVFAESLYTQDFKL
ncbi:helicase SKI2W isoform X2 [Sitophilus oryzae]|uniref:Helicase SKI2W isoform X2 n=1 Tax=Sitophilus oryzae TaxID=7048 RepID=A0A6J2YT40_SITOR|nr:helicase SKI2W isoform X2 [Sitophilus oryzae]